MSYLAPSEFVTKMVDAGESKIFMSTRDTLIRAFMAGAILALAAVFAVMVTQQTGYPIIGAILFPVGFCMLYLLGFDLVTGVFVLAPLALLDKRPGVTLGGVMRNWGLVFCGNFAGAFTVAVLMSIIFTFAFTTGAESRSGKFIAHVGESRTIGYKEHGAAGMLTLFVRGMLCNWMVSTGVVGAMISTSVSGKVIAMWMPIMVFFAMTFEHSVVNMFLFPSGILMGANFNWADYFIWNEIPTIVGNIVGGLAFTGPHAVFDAHARPRRSARLRSRPDVLSMTGTSAVLAAGVPYTSGDMSGQLKISLGQYSDKGRKETNQDFHGACIPEEPQLAARASPSRWPMASAAAA